MLYYHINLQNQTIFLTVMICKESNMDVERWLVSYCHLYLSLFPIMVTPKSSPVHAERYSSLVRTFNALLTALCQHGKQCHITWLVSLHHISRRIKWIHIQYLSSVSYKVLTRAGYHYAQIKTWFWGKNFWGWQSYTYLFVTHSKFLNGANVIYLFIDIDAKIC